MKQFLLLLIAILTLSVISCDKNTLTTEQDTKSIYSDEEIMEALKFVGQGGYRNFPTLKGEGITIVKATPHRKSKECKKGLGLCDVTILGIDVNDMIPFGKDDIILPYHEGMFEDGSFKLLLAEVSGIDMSNVQLTIDEDIDVYDENNVKIATIKANAYQYQRNIGDAGGFIIESMIKSAE